MLSNIIRGQIGETEFMLECLSRGITVSKPFSTQSRYDFITEFNGTLKKVQVKTSGSKERAALSTNGVRYKKADVDVFAITTGGRWYLIPFGITGSHIRLSKNGVNKKHLNKWELLKS